MNPELERIAVALEGALDLEALWFHGAMCFEESAGAVNDIDFHAIVPTMPDPDVVAKALPEGDLDYVVISSDDARSAARPFGAGGVLDTAWPLHRAHWHAGRVIVARGPHPREVVPEPAWAECAEQLHAELDEALRRWPDSAYTVMQTCRVMLSLARKDAVVSKAEAGAWALRTVPEQWHPLIEAAARMYRGPAADADDALVRAQGPNFARWARDDAFRFVPLTGMPEVRAGDDLGALIAQHGAPCDGDVVVVAQKVVSKAEGRTVPIDPARREAERARVVASQTRRVLARRGDLVIVETEHGFVCAHAGVDGSNIEPDRLVLLPEDPDASAARVRARLREILGVDVAVIVADTFGRPWRVGQTNVALGVAGIEALRDHRGGTDTFGTPLVATLIAVADELAGAAELVMGKTDGVPVAIVRGYRGARGPGSGRDLIRPAEEDLFPAGSNDA